MRPQTSRIPDPRACGCSRKHSPIRNRAHRNRLYKPPVSRRAGIGAVVQHSTLRAEDRHADAGTIGRSTGRIVKIPVKNLSRTPWKRGFLVDSRDSTATIAVTQAVMIQRVMPPRKMLSGRETCPNPSAKPAGPCGIRFPTQTPVILRRCMIMSFIMRSQSCQESENLTSFIK